MDRRQTRNRRAGDDLNDGSARATVVEHVYPEWRGEETGFVFVVLVVDVYEEKHEDGDREREEGDDTVVGEGREQDRGEVCGDGIGGEDN